MEKSIKNQVIVFMIFIAILMMMSTCNSCNSSKTSKRSMKIIDSLRTELSTTNIQFEAAVISFRKELKIESLKAESRMIQATDRKILDINRQKEIEKEIIFLQTEQ